MDQPDVQEPQRKRRNREHTNSKFGCAQCKARKVKCDESRPSCRSCTRRGTPCTYLNDRISSNGLNELARLAASSPHGSLGPYSSNSTTPNFPPSHRENPNPAQQHPNPIASYSRNSALALNMSHLELLHHFTTVTAPAITRPSVLQDLWTTIIPKIAISHDFLMHAILALSALHLYHLNPSQREYSGRARDHTNRALELAHQEIARPTRENADALFAFVFPIVYYAFASPESNPRPGEQGYKPLQGVIQCINLLRGVKGIIPPIREYVEAGPLAPLLGFNPDNNPKASPSFAHQDTETHFSGLLLFCSTQSAGGPSEMENYETFAAAASSLRAVFLKVESLDEGGPGGDLCSPPIWQWAVRLPSSFVQRLAEGEMVPVVLVAHWCVLLLRIRHYWWIDGWVERTMREIKQVCPEEGRPWLEWPLRAVGEAAAAEGRGWDAGPGPGPGPGGATGTAAGTGAL